ncbi:YggT family protein [Thiothrix subterranea]|uniref:YggT family protein n=1 Tax=Thiothrix subterranea TaxID=2735563 RepID=A0AA51R235_9GAMM|nr:YggT family protein [Thiothrix subterranea]MDQ5770121.1 YggT family protein [Thiothrix subterranea]QQZ29270.1 YggT family protein [Thiothrix subterranea]WML87399.1 YggT family protein [Thiothrix subterranea]
MEALQNIGILLVEVLFSFYIGAILIRFLLALSRANFYNPLSQSLVKITNPVLVPLRRMIPAIGKLDTASIVLALSLKIIQTLLLVALQGSEANLPVVFVYAIIDLLRTVIYIYIAALIIQAVLSWVGNSQGNPLADLLHSLTEPLLRPVRQFVPVVGMMDFAPMVAMLLLYIVLIVLQSFGL